MGEFEIMKARIARFDVHYEVNFSRPAFSRIASFSQIIEPIYDAFSSEMSIPSDAIKLENGNSIDTAGVTLTLFSGLSVFEAKLDGYKAHMVDLRSQESIDEAKRHAILFETAVCGFLADGTPRLSKLITPSWLSLDGGASAADALVRNLTWLPESTDPFQIGTTNVRSMVRFECSNTDEQLTVGVTVDRSALRKAHLFLEISNEFGVGTQFDNFDKKVDHLSYVTRSVFDKLGLEME